MFFVVLYNDFYCFIGYYCLLNIINFNQYFCFVGIFNNQIYRIQVFDCQSCFGGMYCDQEGLILFVGSCQVGYYCISGVNSFIFIQDVNVNICFEGFYCLVGTVIFQFCFSGIFNSFIGRQVVGECINCIGGQYCSDYNMIVVGLQCF